MGLYQQARILLQHHRRLCGSDYGGYGSADSEIYGRGAEAEDPVDLPRYVTRGEARIGKEQHYIWMNARRAKIGDGRS
jgi:hypothetical protein